MRSKLNVISTIPRWLGITSPRWLHEAIARRNIPVVMAGAFIVALFSAMLSFYLVTGLPCPVDGFDRALAEDPDVASRFLVSCSIATVILLAIAVVALMNLKRGVRRPGIVTAMTVVFIFIMSMVWGMAEAGNPADRQLLIFASIQFLAAGLLVLDPLVSLVYFAFTFFIFGISVNLAGQMSDMAAQDLVYLMILDVAVSWVVNGLFVRGAQREHAVFTKSQRDELTGAKNRHCLRDDFSTYLGKDIFVMLCDIDDFKHYNDEYDHSVGDHLLQQFYYALREAFGDECVYRYGGDEFLIVSMEFGEEEFARKIGKVDKQLARVTLENASDAKSASLTYSGGYVSGLSGDNAMFRALLHTADERLLEAKRAGKNQVKGD